MFVIRQKTYRYQVELIGVVKIIGCVAISTICYTIDRKQCFTVCHSIFCFTAVVCLT